MKFSLFKNVKKWFFLQKGQSLIELLVTIGLAAVILPALLVGFAATRNGRAQEENRQTATALVREGQEAMRVLRESDWATFAAFADGNTYYPCQKNNSWSLCSGADPGIPAGFTRTVHVTDVYRDATTFAIVTTCVTGCYKDPSIKQVTTTVSWNMPIFNSQVSATEYLIRMGDAPLVGSGTVQPPAGGGGDWCSPSATPAAKTTLSGGLNDVSVTQGSGDVISFVGSGNSANGLTYADINITDPASPTAPVPTIVGSVNNNPQIKTNGAFNEVNYGYLATDQHATNAQGIIVDLAKIVSDPTHSIVGTLDLGIAANGQSVFVANSIAYLTADDGNLYTFDISTRSGSHTPIGHVLLAGGGSKTYGKKIVVVGSKAYVAVTSSTNQLQIIDLSDPTHPGNPISVSTGNNRGGKDLFVDANRLRVYLVTSYASASIPDFFTIDVNPSETWYKKIINTYITASAMNPTGVVYVTGSKAVIVGVGSNWNYQVIDASAENIPAPALSICGLGGLHVSYDIYGVATLFTNASRTYSYIITADSGKEYKVIEGGTGSGGTGNGIYESNTFDAGHDVAFNYFTGTTDPSLSYKIDIEKADGSGNCPATFTNFTAISTGSIPFSGVPYANPGRCMRYQVINTGITAKDYSVSINYSP